MNIQNLLSKKFSQAFIAAGASVNCEPHVRHSVKVQFGDYQVNGVMAVAKKLGIHPREFAERVLTHLNLNNIAIKIEIVDPGFINIFLNPRFLALSIDIALKSERLGIIKFRPQTIVVDYSAPNIAKEMHVGHLRSTIIGDVTVRTLEFLGHKVIRANHIGDWGTQFGMLIAFFEKLQQENTEEIELKNIENFYRKAKEYFDKDKHFAERARKYVVKLQNGDKHLLKIWHKLIHITMVHNQTIYDRLNVTLTHDDVMGESYYNPMLSDIILDLKSKGLAVESNGAIVVFLDEFKNKEGKSIGVIIQKRDGGYLYTTTDIACIKYRYETLHADRIIYYTDSRQRQHLMQVWIIVRKAGYVPDSVSIENHTFGMILGKDGKPLKTRVGDNVKLSNLIDEALKRARCIILKKNPGISNDELEKLANVIGIGALKYADLSKNRTIDYVFNWDNMLSFDGNTALYIQYTYTRINSILNKSGINELLLIDKQTIISENLEARLATQLLKFEEVLVLVARNGTPHIMCLYLYEIAELSARFYEQCPILPTKNETIRNSRLKLALLTAKTLKLGLNTLGIATVERM